VLRDPIVGGTALGRPLERPVDWTPLFVDARLASKCCGGFIRVGTLSELRGRRRVVIGTPDGGLTGLTALGLDAASP
jgi:hypothetical protein